jgi:hypothetical protein
MDESLDLRREDAGRDVEVVELLVPEAGQKLSLSADGPSEIAVAHQEAEPAREGRMVSRVGNDHGIPIVHQVAAIERVRGDLSGAYETGP